MKKACISYLLLIAIAAVPLRAARQKSEIMLLDGRNNHDWRSTSPFMRKLLEDTGIFAVEIVTAPRKGQQSLAEFKPDFESFDAVVMNYNDNKPWPEKTRKAFEDFVANGGGLVIVHAADNAFSKWEEFNKMIALGGWGGRNEKSGPMIRYRDGKIVRDNSPGRGGTHGHQRPCLVKNINTRHPITAGLPAEWMHAKDELYACLRGPAENMTLLSIAKSKKTGEYEPVLFTVDYGKGRVFHTVLGHSVERGMTCIGFIATLQRGTEWAATGKVTQEPPAHFPTAEKVSKMQ